MIPIGIAVLVNRWDIAQNKTNYIQHAKLPVAQTRKIERLISPLKRKGEEIIRHHIKQQMHQIGVYEPAGYKGIYSAAACYAVRMQDKSVVNIIVIKSPDGETQSNSKYKRCYRRRLDHLHNAWPISILQKNHHLRSSLTGLNIRPTG